jgi:hypothetical protein
LNDPVGDWLDANGDPTTGNDAGDLVAASSGADAHSTLFTARVASPTVPATDPNWRSMTSDGQANTSLTWLYDTDYDGTPDGAAVLSFDGGRLGAILIDIDGFSVCAGTESFDGSTIVVKFSDPSCPHLGSYRWDALMQYDSTPGVTNDDAVLDLVPEFPHLSAATPLHRTGYIMLGADGKKYGFGNSPAYKDLVPSRREWQRRATERVRGSSTSWVTCSRTARRDITVAIRRWRPASS